MGTSSQNNPQQDLRKQLRSEGWTPGEIREFLITREIPQRILDISRQREAEQLAAYEKVEVEKLKASRSMHREATKGIDLPDSYTEFKDWALQQLAELGSLLTPPSSLEELKKACELTKVVHFQSKLYFDEILEDTGYRSRLREVRKDLSHTLSEAYRAAIQDKVKRVELIDLAFHLHRIRPSSGLSLDRKVVLLIDAALKDRDFELIGRLLARQKGVERFAYRRLVARGGIEDALEGELKKDEVESLARFILVPLSAMVVRFVYVKGLQVPSTMFRLPFRVLKQLRDNPEMMEQLADEGVDFEALGKNVAQAFLQKRHQLGPAQPTHSLAHSVMIMLGQLYRRDSGPLIVMDPQVRIFLNELYRAKVSSDPLGRSHSLHGVFDAFVQQTGIPVMGIQPRKA